MTAAVAADGLKKTLLMFDQFHDVKEKADKGNAHAKAVLQSWADAEWFTSRPEVPQSIKLTVFKVTGETNTDDLSPAPDAWSRPDIPLHALAMLKKRDGAPFTPEEDGKRGPIKSSKTLQGQGLSGRLCRRRGRYRLIAQIRHQLGAVVHRRRHSVRAEQARRRRLLWQQNRSDFLQHHGRCRRVANRIDVSQMNMGDVIDLHPYDGKVFKDGKVICRVHR